MAKKQGNRIFVWIVLFLLLIGMIGFGATGLTGTVRTLGTVGDQEIALNDYARELNQQIRAFEAQIGTAVSLPQAQALGIDRQVLSRLVAQAALDNETARLGLSVGDARVGEQVVAISAFQGLDGQFNREAYRDTLDRQGQTEAEFESGLRREMTRTILQAAIVGGIPQPVLYPQKLVEYLGERRNITWAALDSMMLKEPLPQPTDAELEAFYAANPALFTLPETRETTYVWLTPEMIQDSVEVDEQALQDLYQQRIADFVRPERRLVERLVFADADKASAAIARVTSGEVTFDELVAERGLNLADIDLGDVAAADLGAAGGAVFAAQTGDVVGPLDSNLGPALFRVNAVLDALETTFEEARPELRDELAAARARRVIDEARGAINDLMAGGATLEDLDGQTDLQIGTIEMTAETDDGVAAYDAFRTAALAAAVGEYPSLGDLEDGGIFALRVDAVREPALQEFDDVRASVRRHWYEAARLDAVYALAEDLATQILPLTGFDTLGMTPSVQNDLTRRSFVDNTPPSFLADVFDLALGEVKVLPTETGAVIVRLDLISGADEADPTLVAERSSIAERISQGIAQDLFDVYSSQIQSTAKVDINQSAVNAVNAQFQ